MKRLYSLTVRGKHKTWGFTVSLDPKYLDDWISDGLELVEIANTIPLWVVQMGIPVGLWCFCQDIFSFRNPFRG